MPKLNNFGDFSFLFSNIPGNSLSGSPTENKAKFDIHGNELKSFIQNLINILNSVDGANYLTAKGKSNIETTIQSILTDLINNKVDVDGNFIGTWNGLRPTQTNEFIQSQVDSNTEQLINIMTNVLPFKAEQSSLNGINDTISSIANNKRDKSVKIQSGDLDTSSDFAKIKLINLSDEVKQAMAGTTPITASVGKGAIGNTNLAKAAITFDKTNFLLNTENLFDKDNIILGYYVDGTNGNLVPEIPAYPQANTNYIPVKSNTTYVVKYTGHYAFYDSSYNYISGSNTPAYTFTSPSNAAFLMLQVDRANLDTQVICEGTSLTTKAFKFKMPKLLLDSNNFDASVYNVAQLKLGKNLFNKATAIDGKYVDATSGNLANEIAPWYYWASDFIEIIGGQTYHIPTNEQIAWYDVGKVYISGSSNYNTFTAPNNAKYIRISVPEAKLDTYQLELGTAFTGYEPWGYRIDNFVLPNNKNDVYFNQKSTLFINSNNTYQLAWKRLLKNYNPNTMRVSVISAPVGSKLKDNYIELNNVPAGLSTLVVHAEYLNGEEIITQNINIQSSDKTVKTTQQYLLKIGDSLTRELGFTGEVTSELTNITAVGLRSMNNDGIEVNEGRGGWTLARYATQFIDIGTVENPFMFPNGVAGNMYFGNTESWKQICYTNPTNYEYSGFQLIARDWVVGGTFQYDTNGYRINPPTGAVMYDPNKATGQKYQQYNGTAWVAMTTQPSGVSFDFGKYLDRFKVAFGNGTKNPTIISIMLGTNDLQNVRRASMPDMLTIRSNLSIILNSIKAWNPNVKIILCIPPLSSVQDRWGDARGVDMTKWEFDNNIHLYANELVANKSYYPMNYEVCNMIGALWDDLNDQQDWLHPTAQGKAKLGKWLAGTVQYVRP